MPLEQLVPYFRGARFANVALRLRHPDDQALRADTGRYIAMCDHYTEAAVATFRLKRDRARAASGGGGGEGGSG
jgi:hypothetical protein